RRGDSARRVLLELRVAGSLAGNGRYRLVLGLARCEPGSFATCVDDALSVARVRALSSRSEIRDRVFPATHHVDPYRRNPPADACRPRAPASFPRAGEHRTATCQHGTPPPTGTPPSVHRCRVGGLQPQFPSLTVRPWARLTIVLATVVCF